jgi:transposase
MPHTVGDTRRSAMIRSNSAVPFRPLLAPHYSNTGRPSVDPELMIRMLILGYVFAIRSERALCCEVQLNLAYRWFCGLGIEDKTPDHSAFTRARNERFRDHDVFRHVFERVVASCIKAGLVGGNGFAVDASLIAADANKCRSTPGDKWSHDIDPTGARRAVQDYLANLDDPAWGRATDVVPKFVAPSDPAAQWTGALRNAAFFAYADNYLIDIRFGIIMDVEASRAMRQSEVGASQTMIERTEKTFGIKPDWLVADTAYGSAPNLHFLVDEKGIAPHIPVIDKSQRDDGTFSRDDFIYDEARDHYVCLSGKILPRSSGARGPRGITLSRISRASPIAATARSNRNAVQTLRAGRSHATCTRRRAMSPARSPRRLPTSRPDGIARRLRCCSPTSSGFCGSAA